MKRWLYTPRGDVDTKISEIFDQEALFKGLLTNWRGHAFFRPQILTNVTDRAYAGNHVRNHRGAEAQRQAASNQLSGASLCLCFPTRPGFGCFLAGLGALCQTRKRLYSLEARVNGFFH